jgi:hypothetical protein
MSLPLSSSSVNIVMISRVAAEWVSCERWCQFHSLSQC